MQKPDYRWHISADPHLIRRFRVTALILGESEWELLDKILRAFVEKYGNIDSVSDLQQKEKELP